MNVYKILLTSASVCSVCLAVLLTQSVFTSGANASSNNSGNILERVENLELAQDDNDKAFFLIDTSLNDLDARVLELEKRADARTGTMKAMSARITKLRALIREGN
jgi:peptidoglycan hydrolase CwlO-like protein